MKKLQLETIADDRLMVLDPDPPPKWIFPEVARAPARVPERISAAFRQCRLGHLPWPLMLSGTVGVGKTRACLCMHDQFGGRYEELATYADDFGLVRRGEFRDRRWINEPKLSERDWIKLIRDERLIIVDDIGRRAKESDHVLDTLIRVLNAREGGHPLVLVTNLTPEELAHNYNDRIASRMVAGTVVNVDSIDQRAEGAVVA